MSDAEAPLAQWLGPAWERHADAPREVADALAARAATLPDDADGAAAVRLAQHVLLGHLADPAGLEALLAALPPGPRLDPARARARWALATLVGDAAPALPDAARWSALQDVVQAELARGRVPRAGERVRAEAAAFAASGDAAARRSFAATCNNLALELRLGARGDAARDALMIELAELARRAWALAGTWLQVERADYQLAMCHAALGQGGPAQAAARACLERCEAEGADAAERFFAHECGVHAARAAGDADAAAAHRERMVARLAEIADAGLRAGCADTLAKT